MIPRTSEPSLHAADCHPFIYTVAATLDLEFSGVNIEVTAMKHWTMCKT